MGVSGAVGRWSVGSDGFLGGQPCRVCSGEPCGWHLRLEKDMSAQLVESTASLQKDGLLRALILGGRHQPCAAALFRLEAFGVPRLFREVFPPMEGRAPFFLRPRGTAPVVRLAVCCFWPAIAPEAF